MRIKLNLLLCVLVLFLECCLGRFLVEKNSLRITSPKSLKGSYECAIGNFGVPQYGGTLIGSVVYPNVNQKGCRNFTDYDASFQSKPGVFPTFLLVDRGDCYFTLKAWNAQNGGAAAILVADDKVETLITMDTPDEGNVANDDYVEKINIPSTLISKSLGDRIKKALLNGEVVHINLDWREALPHPDDRVEYELWTNSNDECGPKCDNQIDFVKSFKDPENDFNKGYDGKDVVLQNLRQACFFKVANESGRPWQWWDYVTDFSIRCPMKEKKYTEDCSDQVIKSLGVDLEKINACVGDPDADVENRVLKAEQDLQIGKESRGDITILPTLVINNRQYRGKLSRPAVLKAICSGFQETTEPSICLTSDMETNECLENNGGCWQDKSSNITACRDTFRGRVCECPIVNNVKFVGDGYTHCEASGALSCDFHNGGCWKQSHGGRLYSACHDDYKKGCDCPSGFKGDGVLSCEDIDECKEKLACQCPQCKCENTFGSYECKCNSGLLYSRENDTCIGRYTSSSVPSIWTIILVAVITLSGGYAFYKYRIQRYMDTEIRAIMAQYMPLDNQPLIIPNQEAHDDI
ncbi:unnamed protein product [Vicia faba]|uniref:EGF-like calcium-binding domain-containing protein n=1 Tax=Vicia faba TaxID=3906 RepID=A0AAV1AUC8_VICFA|nr:unnamed protein product [Vicia faba]